MYKKLDAFHNLSTGCPQRIKGFTVNSIKFLGTARSSIRRHETAPVVGGDVADVG